MIHEQTTPQTPLSVEDCLQEIAARYQKLDEGPWKWTQSYEVGRNVYWALESPASAARRRVVSHLLVLRHCYPETFGQPVESDPYLHFIAHSRDDIDWLYQRVKALTATVINLQEQIASIAGDIPF